MHFSEVTPTLNFALDLLLNLTLNILLNLTLNLTLNLLLNLTPNLTLNILLNITPNLTLNILLNLTLNILLNLNLDPSHSQAHPTTYFRHHRRRSRPLARAVSPQLPKRLRQPAIHARDWTVVSE